jgi:phage-related protein
MKRILKFYRTVDNRCLVEDFLDSLSDRLLAKIVAVFKLVEDLDMVPAKFFKKLAGTKLYEIRVEWQSSIYRFPCFFHKNSLVIVTHGFQKKTIKTPAQELDKAKKYREDFLRRNK